REWRRDRRRRTVNVRGSASRNASGSRHGRIAPAVERSRDVAILATVQADGAPLAMPMWFLHDATSLTMISVEGTHKIRNLRRDARAAAGDPRRATRAAGRVSPGDRALAGAAAARRHAPGTDRPPLPATPARRRRRRGGAPRAPRLSSGEVVTLSLRDRRRERGALRIRRRPGRQSAGGRAPHHHTRGGEGLGPRELQERVLEANSRRSGPGGLAEEP